MKIINNLVRFLLGATFIFSGLIKLNDPVGTEIKLEEYFEVFANDHDAFYLSTFSWLWEFLLPYSLTLAILLSVLEVLLGMHVIWGHYMRSTLWMLLGMVIFFGFLTFYSAYFDKVTDCGCFGDAIKLTPWQSFYKDMILMIMILFLFAQGRYLNRGSAGRLASLASTLTLIGATVLGLYTVRYLPILDFRAYHEGASLPEYMEPSDSLQYGPEKYVYIDVNTEEEIALNSEEFAEQWQQYADTNQYTFSGLEKPLLNPEALPRITDFNVTNLEGQDITESMFQGKKFIVIIPDVEHFNLASIAQINQLVQKINDPNLSLLIFTASDSETFKNFLNTYKLSIKDYYFVDKKVLKTMIRSNPGYILMEDGIIQHKWHYHVIPEVSEL